MAPQKIQEKSQPGFVARVWGRLTGSTPEAAKSGESTVREAAGATVDADDDQWRRLTGDGKRDLAPLTQERMQRLAHYAWETNLLANRLIELPLAYMLSQGVKWRIDDEQSQDALDAHWNDGLNNWDIKLPMKARELALFGEQVYPVFADANNGRVRLGYLDPSRIGTVVTDPDNREQPIGIVTKRDAKGNCMRYRVIVNVPESAFAPTAQQIRETMTDGDCFYFRVNGLCAATRGRSDLLAQIDWLDAYDQYLFGEIDRAGFLRAFIWDVTLTGASPDDVTAKSRSISAPAPGSVRVHNENEEWKAESPSLQAADAAAGARLFRNHVLGGATIPEHWFGGAEDVNRSTGQSMSEPTEKMLDMRQRYLGYMLAEIGRYVVRCKWRVLDSELSDDQAKLLAGLRIEWPEMTAKDTTKYAAALQQVVAAIVGLLEERLITRETALRLVAQMAERLGVEIEDVEQELAAAEQASADAGGADLLGMQLRQRPPMPTPGNTPTAQPEAA